MLRDPVSRVPLISRSLYADRQGRHRELLDGLASSARGFYSISQRNSIFPSIEPNVCLGPAKSCQKTIGSEEVAKQSAPTSGSIVPLLGDCSPIPGSPPSIELSAFRHRKQACVQRLTGGYLERNASLLTAGGLHVAKCWVRHPIRHTRQRQFVLARSAPMSRCRNAS